MGGREPIIYVAAVHSRLPTLPAPSKRLRPHRRTGWLLVAAMLAPLAPAWGADHAVAFIYHRFGETQYPSTNIRLEQFEAHLDTLKAGGYRVLPLPEIVSALAAGQTLPERTVAITIDDAYRSAYAEAWPRLRKAGFPFTIFVGTDAVDAKLPDYMSWDQLREMKAAGGVTFGNHTAGQRHLPGLDAAALEAELAKAQARILAELGAAPTLLAFPSGEAGLREANAARRLGFAAAFGQHSGVLHPAEDRHLLPRFAMNEAYGEVQRFRLAADAMPLPVDEITPADPLLRQNPPAFGFTVDRTILGLERLACFHSSFGQVKVERLGTHRVEMRFPGPFPTGRSRLNCTMPVGRGEGGDPRWRWFGRQFYVPER